MGRIETLAEPMSPSISERGVTERRNSPRRKPLRLAYVQFGRENGGMVKDVSEGGMRFHLMNPVAVGQELHFAVAIDAGRRIEGQARMVWTDATGKSGGFSFTELSAPSRDNLRAWLAEMDSPQSIVEPDAALTSAPVKVGERSPEISQALSTPAVVEAFPGAPEASEPVGSLAVLEVGSKFVSQPVPRELWQRAALEDIAPGERTRRPLAAAKAKAMHDQVLASALASTLVATPDTVVARTANQLGEVETVEASKSAHLAEPPNPLRDFLKQPIGGGVFPDESATGAPEPFGNIDRASSRSPNKGWTISRLVMVFALAAICGVAAAFAAIAYRQNIGESLIILGEKISSEPRRAENTELSPPAAAPAVATESPAGSRVVERPGAALHRQTDSAANAVPISRPAPATRQPISVVQPPSSTRAQSAQPTLSGQAQLPSGREVAEGKLKRPPEDVASLWTAVENGDTAAEMLLAERYASGEGVEKNCAQARVLLQAAAKHSEAAARRLAQLSASGCQ
jgi:hypothetical protein